MSTYPRGARLQKGALISLDPLNPVPSVIAFQYNPETLTRSISPRQAAAQGGGPDTQRLTEAPNETIQLKAVLDAADDLERGDGTARAVGIHPRLAALETLLYPSSASVLANVALTFMGAIEVVPPVAPMTLFTWGLARVVPVQLTQLSITEETFDSQLNPIHASVDLSLQVLTWSDFGWTHPGAYVHLAHQVAKEALAAIGRQQ